MPHTSKQSVGESIVSKSIVNKLIVDLDAAIQQAIDNPLLLAQNPVVAEIESACRLLSACSAPAFSGRKPSEFAWLEPLVWQIRARAGRFQMLLDSAGHFYRSCFSSSQPEALAYGQYGEWSARTNTSRLAVDC
jgi:hypothetical protein